MSGKRFFADVQKKLERLGYELSHQTHRGAVCVFVHTAAPDVCVNRSLNEQAARSILRGVERHHGAGGRPNKRDVQAAKLRQAAEREKAKADNARLDAERLRIIAERNALLGGAGAHLSERQILQLEGRVREIEARQRDLVCIMTAPPVGAAPGLGAVKHRAGQR